MLRLGSGLVLMAVLLLVLLICVPALRPQQKWLLENADALSAFEAPAIDPMLLVSV
jgi:hypothetical protein